MCLACIELVKKTGLRVASEQSERYSILYEFTIIKPTNSTRQ